MLNYVMKSTSVPYLHVVTALDNRLHEADNWVSAVEPDSVRARRSRMELEDSRAALPGMCGEQCSSIDET